MEFATYREDEGHENPGARKDSEAICVGGLDKKGDYINY